MIRRWVARILRDLACLVEPERSDLDIIFDRLEDVISGHIAGRGVTGRGFTSGGGVEVRY